MQLPPAQLTEALNICPDLKEPLREHLANFTEAQRNHIPSSVQEIIMKSYSMPTTPTMLLPPPILMTPVPMGDMVRLNMLTFRYSRKILKRGCSLRSFTPQMIFSIIKW